MQYDGVIPVAGFPRVDDMATRRNMQATISDTVQNAVFISFNTHAFDPRTVVLMVIPFGACIIRTDQVRKGK